MDNNCVTIDCSENWKKNQKKLFASNNSCIEDCLYLYEDKWYNECPYNTSLSGNKCINNSFIIKTSIPYEEANIQNKSETSIQSTQDQRKNYLLSLPVTQ